jgi:cytosine/adenosine deaminase-related metal-dependent hydrolase
VQLLRLVIFEFMQKYLIKNILTVNEGKISNTDLLIADGRIEKIAPQINVDYKVTEINGEGKYLLPGCIDDQVHFREPGLTHCLHRSKSCSGRRRYFFYGDAQYRSECFNRGIAGGKV